MRYAKQKGGIMHNKFCVIDNQIVLMVRYNWTNKTKTKNDENVLIVKDPSQATKYSVEFRKLIKKKLKF